MPKVSIRPGMPEDLVAVQAVNLAAFRPIDESFAEILGPEIYPLVYPDWQTSQQRDVEQLVAKPNTEMVVVELDSRVVGFAIVQLNRDRRVGELCVATRRCNSRVGRSSWADDCAQGELNVQTDRDGWPSGLWQDNACT
jgi:hypothetical protein